MNPVAKNILAVLAGALLGGIVNMAIIVVSGHIIPPPAGADVTTEAELKASMHLFQPINFLMPFLAHALGTLVGALITTRLAATKQLQLALTVGVLFLIGGATDVYLLPSPLWFSLTDLILAYLPMAYIGWKLGNRNN